MNSEPERCRRTDGRKWRCSKNVVLNQKYCEGHMHRGRQRSRKLVEPDRKIISKTAINNSSIKTPAQKSLSFGSLTAIPVKTDVVRSQPCKNRDLAGGKVSGYKNANLGTVGNGKKHGMEKINCLVPKSVFGAGHAKPSQKSVTECGPQRCRRTVGRKQQCTRDSLPNPNYCEIHGLKGAKRVISGSQQPTSNKLQATLARAMTKSVDKTINLNSPPFGSHVIVGDNSTGSSSDATTVTDERIGFFVLDYLSDC